MINTQISTGIRENMILNKAAELQYGKLPQAQKSCWKKQRRSQVTEI